LKSKELSPIYYKESILLPNTIFADRSVSVFEAVVEYLKDKLHYTLSEIAKKTNRDQRTIWTVYNRVQNKRKEEKEKKKLEQKRKEKEPAVEEFIPLDVFLNRDIAVLEAVVVYLKDKKEFNYREIGKLLDRNERTVWTVYNRAIKKMRGDAK